jgi:hypothetical protein
LKRKRKRQSKEIDMAKRKKKGTSLRQLKSVYTELPDFRPFWVATIRGGKITKRAFPVRGSEILKSLKRRNAQQEYKEVALDAILAFQVLEELLRQCLERCHMIVTFRLRGWLAYEVTHEDIKRDARSLGTLIRAFARYCIDAALVDELEQLRERRNYVAHEALLLLSDEKLEDDVSEKIKDLQDVHKRAVRAAEKVSEFLNDAEERVRDLARATKS